MKIKLSEGLIEQIQDRLKTPEQQADYLIEKFKKAGCRSFEEAEVNSARQSAQICCDEIIKELERIVYPNPDRVKYWQQVSDYILNTKSIKMKEDQPYKVPFDEQKQQALKDYKTISERACHWSGFIQAAIEAYQDPEVAIPINSPNMEQLNFSSWLQKPISELSNDFINDAVDRYVDYINSFILKKNDFDKGFLAGWKACEKEYGNVIPAVAILTEAEFNEQFKRKEK